ncbi:hypothetical protein KY340_03335 [Candidatus Woesearchaeota archaeon]|nr:hypothetical protein [Candidatus Woesearchaeota archaeon]
MRRGAREKLSSLDTAHIQWNKRGQITIYIIIGIIILLAALLIIYLTFFRVEKPMAVPEIVVKKVPMQVQPVSIFIEDCVGRVGRQGLEKMGRQAGWIDVDKPEKIFGNSFDFRYDPTESDGVTFNPASPLGLRIPYWYYLRSSNRCTDCKFFVRIPTIRQMEQMLDEYVKENIGSCLIGLKAFEEQGFDIEQLGELNVQTTVTDYDVRFVAIYPLKITKGGSVFNLESYYVQMPVQLKRMMELGKEILRSQANQSFLEYNTMAMISAHGSANKDALPPIADSEVGQDKIFWSKFATEQKVKTILSTYTNLVTIPRTHNFYPATLPGEMSQITLLQGLYYGFVFNMLDEESSYDGIDANFFYFNNWPIFFDITPREGDLLRPEESGNTFQGLFSVFSQSYRYFYDVSYPVVVELRDVNAFNGQGFSLMFALETNVRNNKPLTPGVFNVLSEGGPGSRFNMFGNPSQRISGDIDIKTTAGGEPLGGVNIRFICSEDSAYMGTTDGNGEWIGKFPICEGGVLSLSKQDYYTDKFAFSTRVRESANVEGELMKIVTKEARLKVRRPEAIDQITGVPYGSLSYDNYVALLNQGTDDLRKETVYMTITLVPEDRYGETLTSVLVFDKDTAVGEVKLVPGNFEIWAQLIDEEGFTIPASTRKVGDETATLDEVELKPAPLGGAVMNADVNSNWRVTEDNLKKDNYLEFYVLKSKTPTTHEELALLGQETEMSKNKASLILPRWVSK